MADSKIVIKGGKVLREGGKVCSAVDACSCCAGVCDTCHPSNGGSAPSNAVVAGATGCTAINGTYSTQFYDQTGDYCRWIWELPGAAFPLPALSVILLHAKQAFTIGATGGCAAISVAKGEWVIMITAALASYTQREKTTGFTCNAGTGKISGSHTFAAVACIDTNGCADKPTITVAP